MSTFGVGIASPEYGFYYDQPVLDFKHARSCLSTVSLVKQWPYCHKIRLSDDVKEAIMEKLLSHDKVEELEDCENEMIKGKERKK